MLPGLVALALARHDHHLDGGTIAILSSVSLGMPVLWLTWASYRESRGTVRDYGEEYLRVVADELAAAVSEQWMAEAAVRRLNDPYPFEVSWTAADASLADDWEVLIALATRGAGWASPDPDIQARWASGSAELGGCIRIGEVLERVPTRRLVVLGEPGSGKTILMVRLVLDLLAERARGGPVPVLASLASWNPGEKGVHGWLADRLAIDYPSLGAAGARSRRSSLVTELISHRLILPVLDGLDEMAETARAVAVRQINGSLLPGEPIVLTCRAQEYGEILQQEVDLTALRAAAVIKLCPLDPSRVAEYLAHDAGAATETGRWHPVLDSLSKNEPVAHALMRPLMVGLARTIYSTPFRGPGTDLGDPAELCALPDRESVEGYLLDAFIPAAYKMGPDPPCNIVRSEKWLTFLAHHLEYITKSSDLAWWQLPLAPDARFIQKIFWIVGGFVLGLLAWIFCGFLFGAVLVGLPYPYESKHYAATAGFIVSIVIGAFFGIPATLAIITNWDDEIGRVEPVKLPSIKSKLSRNVLIGAGAGSFTGAVIGAGFGFGLKAGLASGISMGAICAVGGFIFSTVDSDSAAPAASPDDVLRHDRSLALSIILVAGLLAWLTTGLVLGLAVGMRPESAIALGFIAGFATVFLAGFPFTAIFTPWPSYFLSHFWLALQRLLPWRLSIFLQDAHKRGILKQSGAVYQFRHIELQRRLAKRHI